MNHIVYEMFVFKKKKRKNMQLTSLYLFYKNSPKPKDIQKRKEKHSSEKPDNVWHFCD